MFTRILAIAVIFVGTSIAWMILGTTLTDRTNQRQPELEQKVISNWGGPHAQRPPEATYTVTTTETVAEGKTAKRSATYSLPLESSRIGASLGLDYRQKGLLWYSTYDVRFRGAYRFVNSSSASQEVVLRFPFPSDQAIYDDLQVLINGKPVAVVAAGRAVTATAQVPAGEGVALEVGYRSKGLDTWQYRFGNEVSQVKDFDLRLTTDFANVDFPEGTLSPTTKQRKGDGWELAWTYRSLMTGQQIGMAMPQRLQPGPLAGEISYFAPVSLLFFFFVMFILTALKRVDLHPMNYFFLATAFFAFHLLLAYLVDHISIHLAFVICSVVSLFLVISYLRLVTGLRFAAVEAGAAQLVYLILFSYAFFFRGFTGLAITIGAILTLFIVMQVTGRIRWGAQVVARNE